MKIPALIDRRFRDEAPYLLGIFLAVFALYTASAAGTVVLEDDGLFAMASYFAGVAHPPGYPLHSMLGALFSQIPVGSVAFRIHMLSAFFGALTCSALFWSASKFVSKRSLSVAAVLAFAASENFWSQSIIGDVYSLNTFLFFSLLALSLELLSRPNAALCRVLAFVYGLALTNHWPLLLVSALCLLVLLLPRMGELWRPLAAAIPFGLLGLTPYAWMVWRSQVGSVSFAGPIDSFDTFVYFVTRQGYSDAQVSASAGWADTLRYFRFHAVELAKLFTLPGALVSVLGFLHLHRSQPRTVVIAFAIGILGPTMVLHLLITADYEYLQLAIVRTFPLVAFGIVTVGLAAGYAEIDARASVRFGSRGRAVAPLFGTAIALSLLALNGSANDRSRDRWAHEYANHILSELPPGALLFMGVDSAVGPIGYMNMVNRVRPDVEVYSERGQVFANRLFDPKTTSRPKQIRSLVEFAAKSERPVYATGEFPRVGGVEDFGFYTKVGYSGKGGSEGVDAARATPANRAFFRRIAARTDLRDPFAVQHRQILMERFAAVLAAVAYLSGDPAAKEELATDIALAETTYAGRLGLASALAPSDDPAHWALAEAWLESAEGMIDDTLSKETHARFYYTRAFFAVRRRDVVTARRNFERSVAIFPHPENPAALALLTILENVGDRAAFRKLRQRVFDGVSVPRVQELSRHLRAKKREGREPRK